MLLGERRWPAELGELSPYIKSTYVAGWTGLEPATSDVTGRRSNQLNYHPAVVCEAQAETLAEASRVSEQPSPQPALVGGTGFEPVTPGV
jgi:hypothetical protein